MAALSDQMAMDAAVQIRTAHGPAPLSTASDQEVADYYNEMVPSSHDELDAKVVFGAIDQAEWAAADVRTIDDINRMLDIAQNMVDVRAGTRNRALLDGLGSVTAANLAVLIATTTTRAISLGVHTKVMGRSSIIRARRELGIYKTGPKFNVSEDGRAVEVSSGVYEKTTNWPRSSEDTMGRP